MVPLFLISSTRIWSGIREPFEIWNLKRFEFSHHFQHFKGQPALSAALSAALSTALWAVSHYKCPKSWKNWSFPSFWTVPIILLYLNRFSPSNVLEVKGDWVRVNPSGKICYYFYISATGVKLASNLFVLVNWLDRWVTDAETRL